MTQPTETETIWVTQEAFDRLKQELEHLTGDVRSDITAKIASAREEGDLKENGGYHAAKDQQGNIEARIRQLTYLLRHSTVGEPPAASGFVEVGTVVAIALLPVWWPELRRYRGARTLFFLTSAALVTGALLTFLARGDRDFSRPLLQGESGQLLIVLLGIGLLLWVRSAIGVMPMALWFSVGLFLAGFLPGLLVMVLYSGYIAIWALLNPDQMPPAEPRMSLREKLRESMNLIPCMLLIALVFVVLLTGWATVSSATLTASGSLPTSTVRALEALYMLELSPETF